MNPMSSSLSSSSTKEEEATRTTRAATTASASASSLLSFDPFQREAELQQQAQSWNISKIVDATADEIPVLDLGPWLAALEQQQEQEQQQRQEAPDDEAASMTTTTTTADVWRDALAQQLRHACTRVGFFVIRNHGVDAGRRHDLFQAMREFFDWNESEKMPYYMEADARSSMKKPSGTGYLPVKHYKLPARPHPNGNECFIVKQNHDTCRDWDADNPWPTPRLRTAATAYSTAMVHLARSHLLPLFARALQLKADYFDEAFDQPSFRLRMTHYPTATTNTNDHDDSSSLCGIHPHVDTSFCTILAQDSPGLVVQVENQHHHHHHHDDEPKNNGENNATTTTTRWIRVPYDVDHPNDLVVNVGEFLGRYWTNDYFVAARHFVQQPHEPSSPSESKNNGGGGDRYSIPFFFNAHAEYVMQCVPTCCSPAQPSKYPPVSYATSQAMAQGE